MDGLNVYLYAEFFLLFCWHFEQMPVLLFLPNGCLPHPGQILSVEAKPKGLRFPPKTFLSVQHLQVRHQSNAHACNIRSGVA